MFRILRSLALPQFEMELGLTVYRIYGTQYASGLHLVTCLFEELLVMLID